MGMARKGLLVLLACLCMVVGLADTALAVFIGTPAQIVVDTSGANTTTGNQVYYGFFNGAPIKWRVMAKDSGSITLMSHGSVASRAYDGWGDNRGWNLNGTADINAWLNGTTNSYPTPIDYSTTGFLPTAFSAAERAAMVAQYSSSSETFRDITIFPSETIVLPSVGETGFDGASSWGMSETDREFISVWWLRSPHNITLGAWLGESRGVSLLSGSAPTPCVVRPAFKLNLSSVLFISAAAGGKSGAVGALEAAQSPSGAVKLTVPDNANLSLESASTIGTVSPGETVSLDYTGAKTGAGKYISCLIVNSSGAIVYYGKLANAAQSNGTAGFTVPAALADGSYTVRLFNEQINADYRTDYASTPVDISMTVGATPPTVTSISPTGTGVATTVTNLILTFNETVTKGTGNITINDGTDTYTASETNATINGMGTSCTATIPLSAFSGLSLAQGTTYTVGVAGGTFKDAAGNSIVANTNVGSFTTQGQVAAPVADPEGGTYVAAQTVELTSATDGATIHYTTDGNDPTATSPVYSSAITVSMGTTLKAIAVKAGMVDSAITTEVYTQAGTVETPTANPGAGTYTGPQTVTLTSGTADASIHYTLDGNDPTTSSDTYSSPITVPMGTTLKAIAVKAGMVNSGILSETYVQAGTVATPVANPAGGTYTTQQPVTLTTATDGATIHYTLDGTDPSTTSPTYNGAIQVTPGTPGTVLKVIAVKAGMVNSAVMTATYVQGAIPSITPTSGTFDKANPQSIAITLDPAGQTCTELTSDAGRLVENTHYSKSGDVYTLLPAYMTAQTIGNHTVYFHMSGGGTVSFALTVIDTTPGNISITPVPEVFGSAGGTVTITVTGDNLDGQTILVELLDKDGNIIASTTRADPGDVTLDVPENTSETEDAQYSVRVTVAGKQHVFTNVITVKHVGGGGDDPEPEPVLPEMRTLTDNPTGVSITGPMYDSTTLRVSKKNVLHSTGCRTCDLIRKLEKEGFILVLYDIELVPPMGNEHGYTVTIPVGTKHNGKVLSILHCENGIPDWGTDTVKDGNVQIGVGGMSPFAVLKGKYEDLIKDDIPKTGDDFPFEPLVIAVVVLITGAVFLYFKKPKSKDKQV